jgi:pimeloyl-ACP methyl ester carboxylesterase
MVTQLVRTRRPARAPRLMRAMTALLGRLFPGRSAAWLAERFLRPPASRAGGEEAALLATARRSSLPTDVGRLAVYTWGDEGPVALLVHGWGDHAARMTPYVRPLLGKGYRVVAFDGPAHGASEVAPAHVVAFAAAVTAVARAVGGVEVIVGHSLGATAAARAVQRGMKVARMAWIAPAASLASAARRFADALGLGPAARGRLLGAIEARVGVAFEALELRAIAPMVHMPVIIVHDREDDLVPVAQVTRAAEVLPAARMFATRGLGHRRILRDEDVVGAAIAFVDDLRPLVGRRAPAPLAAWATAEAVDTRAAS